MDMNILRKYIILSAVAIACAATAAAREDLSKEITVEADFRPTEQKASKLNRLPAVAKSTTPKASLNYSEWAEPAEVPALAPLMLPYGYRTAHGFSKQRGYLDFGIGSLTNIVGNAGYALVNDDATSLNLWIQHNSTWSGRNASVNLPDIDGGAQKQKVNDNIVGLDLRHALRGGTLSASIFYHYDHFNYYGGFGQTASTSIGDNGAVMPSFTYNTLGWTEPDSMQTVNELNITLGWKNRRSDNYCAYSADVVFNHFGLSKSLNESIGNKGNADNYLRLSLFGETPHNSKVNVGANARIEYLGRNFPGFEQPAGTEPDESLTKHTDGVGMLTLSPYLHYRTDGFSAKVGLNMNLSLNDGTALRFAPNIEASATLAEGVAFYLTAGGGKRLTRLCDIFAHNRYIDPIASISNPYTPIDAEAGLKIGPFAGFHATVLGGYGVFKDMPLPYLAESPYGSYPTTAYKPFDIKGWKAGVRLGYRYRSLIDAELRLTYSPQDVEKGYFLGFDRAKCVAEATITVAPTERLKVVIGYELRAKRRTTLGSPSYDASTGGVTTALSLVDIGEVSNLRLGASYQISDMIGVFVDGGNLLNKKWDAYYGMGAQQLNLMGGVSLVF